MQSELASIKTNLAKIDEQAIECASRIASDLGVEASMKGLLRRLEKSEGQQLHGLANQITIVARNVQDVVSKNRRLMESEMTYVDGELTPVARAAIQVRSPYRRRSPEGAVAARTR